jgi:biotin transport system substrate-specific component
MKEPVLESPGYHADTHARTRHVVVAGLLAALLASAAWISFPVGTVPITLQVFVVVLIALLLPPRWAAATIGAYLLLGAIGAPVFASGRAGLGVLFGPTGGYLFGFLAGATLGSVVRRTLVRRHVRDVVADSAAAATTVLVIYALGWTQLAIVTGTDVWASFAMGVAPFIAVDVLKAAVAVGIASALRRVGVVDD